jgi:hypothetical protein
LAEQQLDTINVICKKESLAEQQLDPDTVYMNNIKMHPWLNSNWIHNDIYQCDSG